MADKTIAQLSTILTSDLLSSAVLEIQQVGLTTPESRQVTITQLIAMTAQRSVTRLVQTPPKVGTTAGWVVAAANNQGKMATIPAGQTSSTLVVPIQGLAVGDIITAFHLNGSIQSAGNAGTITADLRSLTAAAAGATDASVGSMAAPLSVTANTIVSVANAVKTGLSHTVVAGISYYVLITATTGASVTEELQSVGLIVTPA